LGQIISPAPAPNETSRSPVAHRAAGLALQFGALACVLAALPFPLFDLDRHSVPKELVLHATALVSAFLCAVAASRLALSRIDALLAGYVVAAAASASFATNPWLSFRAAALLVSGAAAYAVARYLATRVPARPLLTALAGGTVLAAVTALAQAYGWTSDFAALSRAPGGTFGNRNFMAHLLAVGSPVLLLVVGTARGRASFLLGACGVGAVSAALTLSRSRAAWVGLGACLVVSLAAALVAGDLVGRRGVLRRGALLLLAVTLGVGAAATLPNTLAWRSKSPYLDSLRQVAEYQTGSGRGRLIQYRNTWNVAADHLLLGVGPGNWAVEYSRYRTRRDPSLLRGGAMPSNPWPSSDWMALLAEQGLIGAGLFVLVLAGFVKGAWGLLGAGKDPWAKGRGLALLGTVVSTAATGAFDVVLHMAAPALFFWVAAGTLLPPGRPTTTLLVSRPLARSALLGAVALVGSTMVYRSGVQALAMAVASTGPSARSLESASRLDPGSYRLHMMAAEAWLKRGRPDLGRGHAEAAAELFPYVPEPKLLAERCGRRTVSVRDD
jgi:hypothetical protein